MNTHARPCRPVCSIWSAVALGTVLSSGCAGTHTARPRALPADVLDCASIEGADEHLSVVYGRGAVVRVERLHTGDDRYGKRPAMMAEKDSGGRQLRGAELYVRAVPNTQPAYLERVLACHSIDAKKSSHPDRQDPLRVKQISSISVDEAGPLLRVRVKTHDRESGFEVYRRALAMSERVTVRQLEEDAVLGQLGVLRYDGGA